MARFFHPLFKMLAFCSHDQLVAQIEYLKAENEMLRRRLPKRLVVTPAERLRLVRLRRRVGPAIKELISIVHPRTFARWMKQPMQPRKRLRKPGRPRTPEQVREIIIRIARETGWGYTRILGELRKLGIIKISRTTVRSILLENGFDPDTEHHRGTWREFLRKHGETLWACDFISMRIWTKRGLRFAHFLFFINVETRRVIVSPATCHPNADWVSEQARLFYKESVEEGLPAGVLLRDNDGKFRGGFDEVLAKHGVRAQKVTPLSPNLNACAERWAQTVQRECLDHFVILGERHLTHLIRDYATYYNTHRPHQAKGNLPLGPTGPPVERPLHDVGDVRCEARLSGLLRHYYRAAA